MATYRIIAGTTAALRFQLLEAGAPINLTGATVTVLLSDRTGTAVASPGSVSVDDALNGKVSFTPTDANVFNAALSPYSIRWKVVDGSSAIYYVPTGPRDLLDIAGA